MRVLVLGGAGAMGSVAARFLTDVPKVTSLTIADRRADDAERVARSLTGRRVDVSAVPVDVEDAEQLARALADHDIVVNTVGPFYRFGLPVLSAVIESGRHYVDICDDWEPTIEMLALDQRARESGSICIVGAGASPGASNLLAVLAARELDEVDDLFTVWPVDVGDDGVIDDANELAPGEHGPSAAAVHWMQQISGTVRVVEDGQLVDVPPLHPIALNFPGGRTGTVYTVGHPEPITLSVSLGIRRRSANAMLVTPATITFLDDLRKDIDAGRLTTETAASFVERPSLRRQAKAVIGSIVRHGPGNLPLFFALATGSKNGVATRAGATVTALPHGMAAATSAPAAIVVGQVIDGTITTPGVHPPERIVDADAFFVALRPYCANAPGTPGQSVAVVSTEAITP
jgi:lysine 6-dehydrogenase